MLCVGSDGHIEVESGTDGNCASLEEIHSDSGMEKEHCGSCFDFPIGKSSDDECHTYVPIAKQKVQRPSLITIPLIVQSSVILRPIINTRHIQLTQSTVTLRCIRSVHLLL
jgi:hypothetical protein